MSDSYRVTTSTSWFTRLKNSVGGVIIGLLLIVAMIFLLFWNEGRAVTTAKSLAEGSSVFVSVPSESVDPANEGKLVHTTGKTATTSTPSDDTFGIAAAGLRLERSAEMYQWKEESKSETQKKLGGGEETVTTYTYAKDWNDSPIDSGDFKQPSGHSNPSMEIRDQRFQVREATLGAFKLDANVIDRIGGAQDLQVPSSDAAKVAQSYQGGAKTSIVNGRIYVGRNPVSPAIGDYRISYRLVPVGDTSIIGKQVGSGFQAYATKAGDTLLMVRAGIAPAEQMFADAVSENTVVTWVLRVVGLIVLFIGFSLFMSPIGVLADVIPFLGSIVRLGTGTLAFVLALLAGLLTIAVAWFWYRPILSITLIAICIAVTLLFSYLGRKRQASPPAAGPRPPPSPGEPAPEQPPVSQSQSQSQAAPTPKPGSIQWSNSAHNTLR